MKSLILLLIIYFCSWTFCFSQANQQEARFSPAQLHQDLNYLKHLINNVHVYPNTELTHQQYDELFDKIGSALKDSTTATEFLKHVKPVIAYLSDEHAQINLEKNLLSLPYREGAVYLPFTLIKRSNLYVIDELLADSGQLKKGETITQINNVSIADLVKQCALTSTGFPEQRTDNALRQFGYLYPWATPGVSTDFKIKTSNGETIIIKGTILKVWNAYLASRVKSAGCEERLSYIHFGNTGYINACSFDAKAKGRYSLDSIKNKIDGIFKQVSQDNVQKLLIDVSQNEGGNSSVGDYLISCFYDRPYKDYQSNWKKSDEYYKLLKSWGFDKPDYTAAANGQVLHYPSETVSPTKVPYRFKGKVMVVIGAATFSSAMNFATVIRDNHIASLIGQTPVNGHPNGFGEMYYTNLPNTKVFVRFGVKEWIRPAGKTSDNELRPDITLTQAQLLSVREVIKKME